jgi:hypothetical protein
LIALSEHIFARARAANFIARTAQSADAMLRQAEKKLQGNNLRVSNILIIKQRHCRPAQLFYILPDGQKIDAHFSCAQRYVYEI